MNERIQKLWVESTGAESPTNDFQAVKGEELEKFAEKIVRECVNILTEESERLSALAVREKNAYCFDNLSASADKCEDMAMFFKKHFGIENERTN